MACVETSLSVFHPNQKDKHMKQAKKIHAMKVAEYRSCITMFKVYWNGLQGCCSNAERYVWRGRAITQLNKVASLPCPRATPEDREKFERACERLQQCIDRITPEGQWHDCINQKK